MCDPAKALAYGSTASIAAICPGVVVKKAYQLKIECLRRVVADNFAREREIFERLGHHPRIIRYLGLQEPSGLLLASASHGDLQSHLDANHTSIPPRQRLIWCRQLAEALSFIHSRDVIHSDLRPSNILLHQPETAPEAPLDLLLADFGGSACAPLELKALSIPDGPFYSPVFDGQAASVEMDLFGMASVWYVILTGRWPFQPEGGLGETIDERLAWEDEVVYPNFRAGRFPEDAAGLPAGEVMLGCWRREFEGAEGVLEALGRWIKENGGYGTEMRARD